MEVALTLLALAIVFFVQVISEAERDRVEHPRQFHYTLGKNDTLLDHSGKVVGHVSDLPRLRKEFDDYYGYNKHCDEDDEDDEEGSKGNGFIAFIAAMATISGILIMILMFESLI